jgi:uncharacterized membrane protein YfcA
MPEPLPIQVKRRQRLATLITLAVVWSVWLYLMVSGDRWSLFQENWFMSVVMSLGSFIAGATSEGGGAVAFPAMTLGFGIKPHVARDFSLMIQAVGMNAAAFGILFTGIRVERRALLYSSLGGAIGIIVGLEFIAPHMTPAFAKMFFTAVWLSFAFALYWINRYHDREVHQEIQGFLPRHALLLFGTGLVGGSITSITGSGLDIATFALLVLRLRICERIATPTSVVLMGINALVGTLWKGGVRGALDADAWNYWWVCVPIVVVGAPLGAQFIRNRSRLFISSLLYASIAIQSVAALLIIPQTPKLLLFSGAVFACGILFFRVMANHGVRRLAWLAEVHKPSGGEGSPS